MKVIIAGSRNIVDYDKIVKCIEKANLDITEVICGCCTGVDLFGKKWAIDNHIPIKHFPPDWDKHGKKAGILRNQDMADYGEALILVWNGTSRGSKNMLEEARKRKLKVYCFVLEEFK